MALLGSYIATNAVASIASNGSNSFAHGLPSTPDFVIPVGSGAATTAGAGNYMVTADATNVSLFANGVVVGATKVTSVVAHSIIR